MYKFFIFIVLLPISYGYGANIKSKRVCIIGAGIAGISSARYLKDEGINFTIFEATRYIGGTWRYDPRIGTDENGLPLHTSMYKHLRTNLPKPTMVLGGFPLPESLPSFPPWQDYYHYIQDYAKHFDVVKYIKFLHNVILVTRKDDKWRVKYEQVLTREVFEEEYDYIIVANGHYTKPKMPNIPGENKFQGTLIHSHDYRTTDPYKNRRVLVVGGGPSGMDIGLTVGKISKSIIHSRHSRVEFRTPFAANYVKKPDIKEFNETGAIFVDGTFEEVDDVIYCTGFEYDYPFLDESCGLTLQPKIVSPLHRYMVNIKHPSMIVMGLIVRACLVVALDAQARYATAIIKGNFTLPTESEMMQEWEKRMAVISALKLRPSFMHVLAHKEDEYYEALSAESGIDRVPPVMFKIRNKDIEAKLENLYTYRDYEYVVIDDHTFARRIETKPQNDSFEYDYPFLDESCGLTLEPKIVSPLHRYMVNIKHPSMIVMGLIVRACLVVALDAQARYATAIIKGNFTLPTESEMMQEWEKRMAVISALKLRPSFMHVLAHKEDEYYEALSAESGIDRVPPVMFKIRNKDIEAKLENLYTYRDYEYVVIDDHTFARRIETKAQNDSTLLT